MKWVVGTQSLEEAHELQQIPNTECLFALKGHSFSVLKKLDSEEIETISSCSILMNRYYFPSELSSLEQALQRIQKMDIVSIYFADPGLVPLAEKYGLKEKLIYRPETLMTNHKDIEWWNNQGIRVSISPLLSLEEITSILRKTSGNELTIHGHLLMSISRRPLLSSYLEGTQNKTNLTIVEKQREGHMPIYEDEYGTYIYSDFIQNSFGQIASFAKANVERFFIDSSFLEWEEVLKALETYQKILDGSLVWKEDDTITDEWEQIGYYGQKTIL